MGLIKKNEQSLFPLEALFENWRVRGSRCDLHLFGQFFLGWQRERLSATSRSNFLQYRILNTRSSWTCLRLPLIGKWTPTEQGQLPNNTGGTQWKRLRLLRGRVSWWLRASRSTGTGWPAKGGCRRDGLWSSTHPYSQLAPWAARGSLTCCACGWIVWQSPRSCSCGFASRWQPQCQSPWSPALNHWESWSQERLWEKSWLSCCWTSCRRQMLSCWFNPHPAVFHLSSTRVCNDCGYCHDSPPGCCSRTLYSALWLIFSFSTFGHTTNDWLCRSVCVSQYRQCCRAMSYNAILSQLWSRLESRIFIWMALLAACCKILYYQKNAIVVETKW